MPYQPPARPMLLSFIATISKFHSDRVATLRLQFSPRAAFYDLIAIFRATDALLRFATNSSLSFGLAKRTTFRDEPGR